MTQSTTTVQRAGERFFTDAGWLHSWHNFNFGNHYHPAHQGHGLLLVNNDDVVAPGQGFGTHGHRDMEIVTWVLSGRLEHHDSEGNQGVLFPGLAQRMSAGTGIRHSEVNPSATDPVHFVQMWVLPDTQGVAPGYEQSDLSDALRGGGFVAIASGQGHEGAVSIHQKGAVLWGARLGSDGLATIPQGANVHLFVAAGNGELDGVGALSTGDSVRFTNPAAGLRFAAEFEGAELLVWATD
jgi:quercetin 2,3-dioxygenase